MNLLNVYILKCNDNSYYTGVTNNIERRLYEHENGVNTTCYTFSRRPLMLVWHSESMDAIQAIELEKQIKGWRKSKKEALIAGNWDKLIKLAAIRKNKIK